jgi:hypothetical protein
MRPKRKRGVKRRLRACGVILCKIEGGTKRTNCAVQLVPTIPPDGTVIVVVRVSTERQADRPR